MRARVLAWFLVGALAFMTAAWAQQQAGESNQATVAKAPPAPPKTPPAAPGKSKPPINADLAYKANCTRCHVAPRKFSDRATVTILRHMRVRANLTEEEAEAILKYLRQ